MGRSRGSRQTSLQRGPQGGTRLGVERRKFLQQGALAGAAALVGPGRAGRRADTGAAAGDHGGRSARRRDASDDGCRRSHAARRSPGAGRERALRVGLHGGRAEVVELRLHLRQPRVELPRPARVGHQLRREHEARADHLLPRRVVGGDGARVLQGRGQAARRHGARHGWPAARLDGALQRVVRPRSGVHGHRQPQRRRDPARRGVVSRRAGCRRHGARLHEVGRRAVVARAFRRIRGARVQNRGHAADGARRPRARRRPAGASDPEGRRPCGADGSRFPARRVGTPARSTKSPGCSSRHRIRCSSPTGSRGRRTG